MPSNDRIRSVRPILSADAILVLHLQYASTVTDLSYSELPFLNQPAAESSRAKVLSKQDSGTYKPVKRASHTKHASLHQDCHSIGNSVGSASAASPRSASSSDSSNTSTDSVIPPLHVIGRPRSPKHVNLEKLASAPQPDRPAQASRRKSRKNESPEQTKTKPQSAHRTQGLSLQSRDLQSFAGPHSRQATRDTASGCSRIVSTAADSGQVSSFTGLSAGSLARRRLLRRMDKAAQPLEPRSTQDTVQHDLRAFRTLDTTGGQSHGPSAKYGAANVPARSARPIPDVPRPPSRKHFRATSPAPQPSAGTSMHMVNRSPDWFASDESFHSRAPRNAYHVAASPHQAVIASNSYLRQEWLGQDPDIAMSSENRIPSYGLPIDSPRASIYQMQSHHSPSAYQHSLPRAPASYFAEHGIHPRSNFPSSPRYHPRSPARQHDLASRTPSVAYRWELVETQSPRDPPALHTQSVRDMEAQGALIEQDGWRPSGPGMETSSYAEEPAYFQRGRSDLLNFDHPSSKPAFLQPLHGFWQRNYL